MSRQITQIRHNHSPIEMNETRQSSFKSNPLMNRNTNCVYISHLIDCLYNFVFRCRRRRFTMGEYVTLSICKRTRGEKEMACVLCPYKTSSYLLFINQTEIESFQNIHQRISNFMKQWPFHPMWCTIPYWKMLDIRYECCSRFPLRIFVYRQNEP